MRVLFILENYHPHIGGVEIVFRNLASGLAKRGYAFVTLGSYMSIAANGGME